HRRGARAVAGDRADIAAGEVQKAVELVLRVVKPAGAGPAVGAAEYAVRPVPRIDSTQLRSEPVERLVPGYLHEFVRTAPPVRTRTPLQPASADRRPRDPCAVRHRSRDVGEQR